MEREIPKIDAPAGIDRDNEDLQSLCREAMTQINERLSSNREQAVDMTEVEMSVEEVLSEDNIRSIDVRARPLENPKVTLWLRDCPIWANTAWRHEVYPRGLNAYNGRTTVAFDVRPF